MGTTQRVASHQGVSGHWLSVLVAWHRRIDIIHQGIDRVLHAGKLKASPNDLLLLPSCEALQFNA